jgi:cold shock CspA family protein
MNTDQPHTLQQPRKEGSIVRLVRDRAFGFIYCPLDERDYFFHQVQLQGSPFSQLAQGDEVCFVLGEKNGKLEAQQVRVTAHTTLPSTTPYREPRPKTTHQHKGKLHD